MNPELLRNFWLEFSPRRLLLMPAILALLFAGPFIQDRRTEEVTSHASQATVTQRLVTQSDQVDAPAARTQLNPFQSALSRTSFSVAIIFLLFIWGTRLAGDSLFSEVAGRTWDTQRSSAIGPWAMTIGKLFGGTAYVWYGALFCLAFWAIRPFLDTSTVLALIIGGLLAQALALFTALALLRMAPDRTRFRVTFAQVSVILVAALLLLRGSFFGPRPPTEWYIFLIPSAWFTVGSFILFFAWALLGSYRLMRAELQVPTGPFLWIGFLQTLALYVGGFAAQPHVILTVPSASPGLDMAAAGLLLAGLAMTDTAFAAAFLAPPRVIPVRRWLGHRVFSRAGLRNAPAWTYALALAAILILAGAATSKMGSGLVIFGGIADGPVVIGALVVFMFVLRDIGLLHALALNPKSTRGVSATLVALGVSYFVLPFLAGIIHFGDAAPFLRPAFLERPALAIGAPFGEAIIAWLAAARWLRVAVRPAALAVMLALALAPITVAQPMSDDETCPRTTAHEMLLEAGLVFEGSVTAHGPPENCPQIPAACQQETVSFKIDRVLKGVMPETGAVRAMRLSMRWPPSAAFRFPLILPERGLFAVVGAAPVGASVPNNLYWIDECLLDPPPGFAAEAEAYATETARLRVAAEAAPSDADRVTALTDHLLRQRDNSARITIERAIVSIPDDPALRAQYLYLVDPTGQMSGNPFSLVQLKRQMAQSVALVWDSPVRADPANPWVRRRAAMIHALPIGARGFTDFSSFTFSILELGGASLPAAKFVDSRIQGSYLRGADLSGADLRWSDFTGVDLSFAILAGANLSDWNPATRTGMNLLHRTAPQYTPPLLTTLLAPALAFGTGLKLLRATLDHAHLDRANLVAADLRQASLKGAVLNDADLRGVDLRGADMTGADITGARLDKAKADCRTVWPADFSPALKPDPASTLALCQESVVVAGP